jgi:glycosyltransferase involved in cell wall biosynthesis
LTYNGIEMLYNETDNGKLIVSDTGDTEYNYNTGTSIVTLNVNPSKPKRFYESTLYYGNNNAIDMTNAFYYQGNTGAFAEALNRINQTITDDKFKFFGFYDENGGDNPSVHGYASKRWLDYYNVPYSDRYTFNAMRKSAMSADFSWKKSSAEYLNLYKSLI